MSEENDENLNNTTEEQNKELKNIISFIFFNLLFE
jgi:hypothetical protein